MDNQTGLQFAIDGAMSKSVEVIKVISDSFTAKARDGIKKF